MQGANTFFLETFWALPESAHVTVQMRVELHLRRCRHLCGGWQEMLTNTQSSFFTEKPLHRATLHTEAFTQKSRYNQIFLHWAEFLHRETVAHQIVCAQKMHTQFSAWRRSLTHRRLYKQKYLHTEGFTHRNLYTQTLLHIDARTQRCFYTQSLAHRVFHTHTHTFSTQRQGCDWRFKIRFFRPFFCMCWPSFRAKTLQQTLWNRISPQLLHPRQLRHRHF